MTRPACADVPDLPFAEGVVAVEATKSMCRGCSVFDLCKHLGVGQTFGTWAGQSAEERADLSDDALFAVPAVEVEREHSRATYYAGDHGDCAQCRAANARFKAEYGKRPRVTRAERLQQQTDIDLEVTA